MRAVQLRRAHPKRQTARDSVGWSGRFTLLTVLWAVWLPASCERQSENLPLIKFATMEPIGERSLELYLRAFEWIDSTNRLVATVCVGPIVFLIQELDSL